MPLTIDAADLCIVLVQLHGGGEGRVSEKVPKPDCHAAVSLFALQIQGGVPVGIGRQLLAAQPGDRFSVLRASCVVLEQVVMLGAGVDIYSPVGNMIVDIGGGTTDVAVISLGGVVVSQSIKVAGDKFDEAIMRYVRRKFNVAIGERTAERVKIQIGAVYEHDEAKTMEVKGRCLIQGLPKNITLTSKEMLEAMMEPISAVLDAICSVVEKTPPELVGDILKNGIILVGGGGMLMGLDRLIEDVTGIKTRLAKEPVKCVALGTGKVLRMLDGMSEGMIDLSKYRKKI